MRQVALIDHADNEEMLEEEPTVLEKFEDQIKKLIDRLDLLRGPITFNLDSR